MRITRFAGTCILAALGTAPLCAQSVHVVGPGGFGEIGPAIAAAAPGDVIRVATGTYLQFYCDKGVTITALPGAQVDVVALTMPTALVTFDIPPGQLAHVCGIHFRGEFLFALSTEVIRGVVAFEDCSFLAGSWFGYGLQVRNSAALLRNPAIRAVVMPRCRLLGRLREAISAVLEPANRSIESPEGRWTSTGGVVESASRR